MPGGLCPLDVSSCGGTEALVAFGSKSAGTASDGNMGLRGGVGANRRVVTSKGPVWYGVGNGGQEGVEGKIMVKTEKKVKIMTVTEDYRRHSGAQQLAAT